MTDSSDTHDSGAFLFSWYHREEFQAMLLFFVLTAFFSKSLPVTILLMGFVLFAVGLLYAVRIGSRMFHRQEWLRSIAFQYHEYKLFLGRESVTRSRVAMASLATVVFGLLAAHRIVLARAEAYYNTPTDLYWILLLAWYFFQTLLTTIYLLRTWGLAWEGSLPPRSMFLEGVVASLFFYHGLSRHHRLVTFAAGFLLGGIPSYFATRIPADDPFGTWEALGLLVPVIALTLGGAYYAMRCNEFGISTDAPS